MNFIKKVIECGYYNLLRKPKAKSEFEVAEVSSLQFGYHSSRGPEELLGSLLSAIGDEKAKPRSKILIAQLMEYEWRAGKVVHAGSVHSESNSDVGRAHGDVAIGAACGWLGVRKQGLLRSEIILKPTQTEQAKFGSVGWRVEEAKRKTSTDRYIF